MRSMREAKARQAYITLCCSRYGARHGVLDHDATEEKGVGRDQGYKESRIVRWVRMNVLVFFLYAVTRCVQVSSVPG
ncbi:hypothetical protein RJ55_03505 [Drechmeria coniospora]|nr:hypothetical protein RJ55_03505 [Drechmeria coniospora]